MVLVAACRNRLDWRTFSACLTVLPMQIELLGLDMLEVVSSEAMHRVSLKPSVTVPIVYGTSEHRLCDCCTSTTAVHVILNMPFDT